LKWLAEYCGTSVEMIEKHYGRFMQTHAATQLALLMGAKTERAARQMPAGAAKTLANSSGPKGIRTPRRAAKNRVFSVHVPSPEAKGCRLLAPQGASALRRGVGQSNRRIPSIPKNRERFPVFFLGRNPQRRVSGEFPPSFTIGTGR
jgi:hypothetical protein